MAQVPQAFADAVNKLAGDYAALQASYADLADKQAAQAAATNAAQVAQNAIDSQVQALEADKTAISQFLDSLFPTVPPSSGSPGLGPLPSPDVGSAPGASPGSGILAGMQTRRGY